MGIQSKKRPDPFPFLDVNQIRAATFVRHVEIHDTLGSTSDRAAELARDVDIELPALVVARRQTAGRGRGHNMWWSADGALTFSVLLEPAAMRIGTANWPQLSLATAVAVCDALQNELDIAHQRAGSSPTPAGLEDEPARSNPQSEIRNPKSRFGIKWPNDVMFDGRKVCGVLIESPGGTAPAKNRLIIGIGINVNNSWRDAPRDAGPNGTALCDFTGKQHDLQIVLVGVVNAMEQRLKQLVANDPALSQTWQQLCWLTKQEVSVDINGHLTDGRCVGIADDGALLVKTLFTTERVYRGSIRVIP